MIANSKSPKARAFKVVAVFACLAFVAGAFTTACKRTPKPAAATFAVPTHPIYVTNNGSDTLSILDRDGTRVETVSLDIEHGVHEAPHHLALDEAHHSLFVALAFPAPPKRFGAASTKHNGHGSATEPGRLAKLDLATFSVQRAYEVDENPGDVVRTPDGTKVLVSHFDMQRALREAMAGSVPSKLFASLQVYRTEPFEKIGERRLCVAPHGMTVTADSQTAVVACYGSDEIALVDLRDAELPASRFPIAGSAPVLGVPRYGPYSVTLAPNGHDVLVAELEGSEVRLFDLAARKFDSRPPLPTGGRAMMPCFQREDRAFVPIQSPDAIARVDTKQFVLEKREPLGASCTSPHVAACARDGRVYIACEGDHNTPGAVVEIDPESLAIIHRWQVGIYPDGLAIGGQ